MAILTFFKQLWDGIKQSFERMQAEEAQKIADAQARQRQSLIERYDRGIIRKQLEKALSELPEWYSLHHQAVNFEGADGDNFFHYRIAKSDISRHLSMAVCTDIKDVLNTAFAQMHFDAFHEVNYAYQDARFQIQSVMVELSARSDWNSPELQARFNAELLKAQKGYEASYRRFMPFLAKLEAVSVVEDDLYVDVAICVVDETDMNHWAPQNVTWQ